MSSKEWQGVSTTKVIKIRKTMWEESDVQLSLEYYDIGLPWGDTVPGDPWWEQISCSYHLLQYRPRLGINGPPYIYVTKMITTALRSPIARHGLPHLTFTRYCRSIKERMHSSSCAWGQGGDYSQWIEFAAHCIHD